MSVAVRQFLCLSGIFYLACIGNATDVKPGADDTIYSGTGICSKSGHTTLDEKWREIGNGGTGNCDQGLPVGWYKFIINGKPATLPTLCIKNEACGTVVPLRVDLHDQPLPPVNGSLRVSICGSYPILNKWDCCVLRRPAILHNCGSFLVYHLSPPDRCHVGYCVINEDNMMKLHAFTAKTGEASRGAAHPTFIPETTTTTTPSTTPSTTKVTTPSTTKVTTKATTKVTATGIGCPANQRRCPDGCVPLSQSCPMTLDLNPLPKRIVHTFDTVRQTHYFTRRVNTPSPTTTAREKPEVTKDQTEVPSTTKPQTPMYSTEQIPVSTTGQTAPRLEDYTTVISAITTQGNPKRTQTTSPRQNKDNKTDSDIMNVGNSTQESSTLNPGDHGNSTGIDYVDNQNEQPAMDESYCGVVLAFEFQASYLQVE